MSDVIFMLRLEHENLDRVLDLVDDQLQRIESGAPLDDSLLLLAVEYLEGFPEECHHPKEDLLFRLLSERHPVRASALLDLDASHEQLAELTERFAANIRAALDSRAGVDPVPLREFVDTYRRHMQAEEQNFFPAALASLTRDDLASLDFQLFDRKDHLFDHATEARFARLRSEIEKRMDAASGAAGHENSPAATDEIALLRGLKSVDAFNEALAERGLRLVRYRAGGYALERAGKWVLNIPDCSESRAAWCAYFYAKGEDGSRRD